MTWWTMREEGDMVDYEGEGDMVDYEGESDTDLFSLQSLKRGIFFLLYIKYLNSLCVANHRFV